VTSFHIVTDQKARIFHVTKRDQYRTTQFDVNFGNPDDMTEFLKTILDDDQCYVTGKQFKDEMKKFTEKIPF
jgi:hypothetical protein